MKISSVRKTIVARQIFPVNFTKLTFCNTFSLINERVSTCDDAYCVEYTIVIVSTFSATDPGFPVGGANLVGEAPTPEVATFRKICMSKQKNLDPWGCTGGAPWIRH